MASKICAKCAFFIAQFSHWNVREINGSPKGESFSAKPRHMARGFGAQNAHSPSGRASASVQHKGNNINFRRIR